MSFIKIESGPLGLLYSIETIPSYNSFLFMGRRCILIVTPALSKIAVLKEKKDKKRVKEERLEWIIKIIAVCILAMVVFGISKYTKIEIIELPDYSFDIKKTLKEEYNSIMKVFNKNDNIKIFK